jgi:hypothetical protein
MSESRSVLCRNLLQKTQDSVKVLGVDPEKGLLGLNDCVQIIMAIYDSYESEEK